MNFFIKLIFYFFSNLVALIIANHFVEGFEINSNFKSFLLVAAVLTLINVFFRPIIKMILTPVIILTLGLGIFIVNALMLYFLDKLLLNITIMGTLPLIYATLIISLVSFIVSFSAKAAYKK
ncbi:phage holin family protein [Candidatus Wolfebacteria bacterium]|nr:phage holin family protein [Candidatus Wolfebacteria bacterium]